MSAANEQVAFDAIDEIKGDIDRAGKHMADLLNRLDTYRAALITKATIIQAQIQRIMELERENAELRANAVEVN